MITATVLAAFVAGCIVGYAVRRPAECAKCQDREWARKNWG